MTTAAEWSQHAARASQSGRVDEAIAAWHRAVSIDPRRADDWFNLAYFLRVSRRFPEASAAYGEALRYGVARPEEAYVNRAVILSEHLDRPGEAIEALQAALAVEPTFLPALLNLGNLLEDHGDSEAARAAYERALAVDPVNGRALARRAAILVHTGDVSRAIDQLRPLSARVSLDPVDHAEINFALGQALDAAQDYDAAWIAFTDANRSAAAAMPAATRYDPAAHERYIAALKRQFPLPVRAEPSERGASLFVCGMFRSGSTLAEQMLGRHAAITPGGELDFIPALVAGALHPYPTTLARADRRALTAVRNAYLDARDQLHPRARLVTDKRPDNFLHLGLITAIMPDAQVIHTVRDPRDTILSVFFQYFDNSVSYSNDLTQIAHWFRNYQSLMRFWQERLSIPIHQVDYDRLVHDPRAEIDAVLTSLGLPWDEQCLAPERANNLVRTASVWQVRASLHTRSSKRWQNYARHLAPLEDLLPV
ncbi:sulfotransferase [Sphingomonas sp. HHU CXW]|uniref:Sulfotransferase n=1 Tax=Sphingomonas hominis TaxID=2741495 RepID=A0ABX2JLW4_9SPHN|nr:sulfotransferase [Sphingomonas hominis]NTS64858.1 sulfotransferase [Sphingomonas hominis]